MVRQLESTDKSATEAEGGEITLNVEVNEVNKPQTITAPKNAKSLKELQSALGASPLRIIGLHILPNISSAIIVRTSIRMGFAILTAATLGFLGLGAQPPTPEWGRMIAEMVSLGKTKVFCETRVSRRGCLIKAVRRPRRSRGAA